MVKFGLIFLIVILPSCSLFNDYSWQGIESVETINEALLYMNKNINYKFEYNDFWQLPQETNSMRTGDCEDMSSLLAHLFIYNAGQSDVHLVGCLRKSDYEPHMVVRIGNVYYEATAAREYTTYFDEFYTVSTISLENYIDIARLYHL